VSEDQRDPIIFPAIPADATALDAAKAYLEAGFYIGPLLSGDKNPR